MFRKFCMFVVLTGLFGVNNTMAEAILQSVTSEVFYDTDEVAKTEYADEGQVVEDQDFVQNYNQGDEEFSEPMFKSYVDYSEREGYADVQYGHLLDLMRMLKLHVVKLVVETIVQQKSSQDWVLVL